MINSQIYCCHGRLATSKSYYHQQEGKAMGALGPVVYNELIKELLVSRNPEALPKTKTPLIDL